MGYAVMGKEFRNSLVMGFESCLHTKSCLQAMSGHRASLLNHEKFLTFCFLFDLVD